MDRNEERKRRREAYKKEWEWVGNPETPLKIRFHSMPPRNAAKMIRYILKHRNEDMDGFGYQMVTFSTQTVRQVCNDPKISVAEAHSIACDACKFSLYWEVPGKGVDGIRTLISGAWDHFPPGKWTAFLPLPLGDTDPLRERLAKWTIDVFSKL